MAEMTPEDLTRIRDAVRRRDRCADAAIARCQHCGIPPLSASQAWTAYDAMLPLIAAAVRAQVAEEIAQAIEDRDVSWPGMSDQAKASNETLRFAARIARQHSGEVPQ